MSRLNYGPITPFNIMNDPVYLKDLEIKKPKPRIRGEDKWIKDIQEKGSVGVLFELQGLETKIQELQLIEREKSKMRSKTVIGTRRACERNTNTMNTDRIAQEDHEKTERNSIGRDEAQERENSEMSPQLEEENEEDRVGRTARTPPVKHTFLRAHQNSGPPLGMDQYPPIKKIDINHPDRVRVSVATRRSANLVHLERRQIDYIRANAYALQSDKYRHNSNSVNSFRQLDMSKYKKGELPKYLKVMKNSARQQKIDTERLKVPKERLLTGSERKIILDKLNSDLQNVYNELNRMPISMETIKSRTRKDQLERQIDEINNRINIFNKPNIYVT